MYRHTAGAPKNGMRVAAAVLVTVLSMFAATITAQPSYAAPPQASNTATDQIPSDHARVVSLAEFQELLAKTITGDGCGSGCDYKDPATYKNYYSGCATCYYYCSDDAVTPYKAPDDGPLWVELRYSPRCQTAWARAPQAIFPKVFSYYMSGAQRTSTGQVASGSPWSNMLNDAGLLAKACGYSGPSSICTKSY